MPASDADRIRLQHMLQAGREAVGYAAGLTRESLEHNRQVQHSVVRCVEILGEAASRLSSSFRTEHSEVPWQNIIAMRNRLIHAYYDIDLDLVWQTAITEVPALLEVLDAIAADLEKSAG